MRKANTSVPCPECEAGAGAPCRAVPRVPRVEAYDQLLHPARLAAALLATIAQSTYRFETSLCREFGGSPFHVATEDALYQLVREGKLEWYTPTGDDMAVLRYRIPARPCTPAESGSPFERSSHCFTCRGDHHA